jgi:hypothetical protein
VDTHDDSLLARSCLRDDWLALKAWWVENREVIMMNQPNLSQAEVSSHVAKLLVFYRGCLSELYQSFDALVTTCSGDELLVSSLGYHYQVALIARKVVALSKVHEQTFVDEAVFYQWIDDQVGSMTVGRVAREAESCWHQYIYDCAHQDKVVAFFVSSAMRDVVSLLQEYTRVGHAKRAMFAQQIMSTLYPSYHALSGVVDNSTVMQCLSGSFKEKDEFDLVLRQTVDAGCEQIRKTQLKYQVPGFYPRIDAYSFYAQRFLEQMQACIKRVPTVGGVQDVGKLLHEAAKACGIKGQAASVGGALFTIERVQQAGQRSTIKSRPWTDCLRGFDNDNLRLLVIAGFMAIFMMCFDVLGSLGMVPLILATAACSLHLYDITYDFWLSKSTLDRLQQKYAAQVADPSLFVTLSERRMMHEVNDTELEVKHSVEA